MSDQLNNRVIEHYLDFISDGFGMVQIDEPVGFDASMFTSEQEDGRYGRDIYFSGDDEIDFTFTSVKNNYGFYFDKLIEYDKIYGFEMEVRYLLRDVETDEYYIVGQLETKQKKTDQWSYFTCVMGNLQHKHF